MKSGVSGRLLGMGKSGVAYAHGVESLTVNPSGLSTLQTLEVNSMYVNMFDGDVTYTTISGGYPFKFGNVGGGMILTGAYGAVSPSSDSSSTFDYYDRLFYVSYGDREKDLVKKLFKRDDIELGGTLKLFMKGFSGGGSNTGFGIDGDIGALTILKDGTKVGLTLQNFLPLSVKWSSGAEDEIPFVIKGGASRVFKIMSREVLCGLDGDWSVGRNYPILFHTGGEYYLDRRVAIRIGLDQTATSNGSIWNNLTFGVGFKDKGFSIDYGYHPYVEAASDSTHYISITYSPEIVPKKEEVKIKATPNIVKKKQPVTPIISSDKKPVKLNVVATKSGTAESVVKKVKKKK